MIDQVLIEREQWWKEAYDFWMNQYAAHGDEESARMWRFAHEQWNTATATLVDYTKGRRVYARPLA